MLDLGSLLGGSASPPVFHSPSLNLSVRRDQAPRIQCSSPTSLSGSHADDTRGTAIKALHSRLKKWEEATDGAFNGKGPYQIQRSHAYDTAEAANEALNVGWEKLQDAVRKRGPVDGKWVRLVEYDPLGFVGNGESEVGEFKPFLLTCGVYATHPGDIGDNPSTIFKDAMRATATMKCEIRRENVVRSVRTAAVDLRPLTKEETPAAGTLNALELILFSDTSSENESEMTCRKWLGKDDILQSSATILKLFEREKLIREKFTSLTHSKLSPVYDTNPRRTIDKRTRDHLCTNSRVRDIGGDWTVWANELLAYGRDNIQLLAVDEVKWMKQSASQSQSRRIKDFRIKRNKRRELAVKSSKRFKLVNGKEGKRLRRAISANPPVFLPPPSKKLVKPTSFADAVEAELALYEDMLSELEKPENVATTAFAWKIQRSHAYDTAEAAIEALNVGWKKFQDAAQKRGQVDGDRVRLVEYDPLGFVGNGTSRVGESTPFLLTCEVHATNAAWIPNIPRTFFAEGATATMKCEIQGNEDPVVRTADVDLRPLTKEETPLAGTLNALQLILFSDTSGENASEMKCRKRKWLGKDAATILKLFEGNKSIHENFTSLTDSELSGTTIDERTGDDDLCVILRKRDIGKLMFVSAVELIAYGHDRTQLLAVDNVEWENYWDAIALVEKRRDPLKVLASMLRGKSRRTKDFRIKRKKRRQLAVKSSKRSKFVNGKEGKRLRRAKSAVVRKR